MTRNDRLLAAAWTGWIVCFTVGVVFSRSSTSNNEQNLRLAKMIGEISSVIAQQEHRGQLLEQIRDHLEQEIATNTAQRDFYRLLQLVLLVTGTICMFVGIYFGRRSESEPNGEVAESAQVTVRANENKLHHEQTSK